MMPKQNEKRSQAWCAATMFREAKRFFFATRLLPRAKRKALEALYAVFRTADDLADEPGFSDAQRRCGLAAIRHDLRNVRSPSQESTAPWFAAVHAAFARYPIAISDALGVVDGCAAELDEQPIVSLADLERVAAAITGGVARCAVAILGACDEESLQRAQQLGVAMQLTNMLRDCEEDRARGRDYFGFAGQNAADLLHVKRDAARRAKEYYEQASALAAKLPNDGSATAVLIAAKLYRAILERLERSDFKPRRPRTIRAWRDPIQRTKRTHHTN
jgi:15-cis-phytoene synthase